MEAGISNTSSPNCHFRWPDRYGKDACLVLSILNSGPNLHLQLPVHTEGQDRHPHRHKLLGFLSAFWGQQSESKKDSLGTSSYIR